MYTALREKAIVTTEGVLEIRSSELLAGTRVEVIILVETPLASRDDLGWPEDFFATFAGCLPDFPARESAGDYETRAELP
jgi:hypothetical protein